MDTALLKGESINKRTSIAGIFLATCTGGAALAISIICYPFVSPALRRICLPFVPATPQQIANVLQAVRGRPGNLLDIGSGDGRIVLAAARCGFKSDGVELNPWLVFYSRLIAFKSGLSRNTSFYRADLWKFNLQSYNNIVIFGVKEMMEDLNKKFEEELTDSQVVACRFPLPTRTPIKIIGEGIDRVWVYNFSKKT